MLHVKKNIEDVLPGVFVHNIVIGGSSAVDRIASFYDDLNRQVPIIIIGQSLILFTGD